MYLEKPKWPTFGTEGVFKNWRFQLDLVVLSVLRTAHLFAFLRCSLPANKDVVPNGSVGGQQSSSGFQPAWCGVPGQMSMADVVKMGRPQVKSSGKPIATTDISFAGQTPSLSSSVNQNSKHSASTALATAFDQGFPALPDPIPQNLNSSHASAENNQMHENDWFPQDEPPLGTQSKGIDTSGDASLSVTPFDSSVLVADAAYSQESSHTEENSSTIVKPAISSERHLEILEENHQFNDGLLQNSSTYQSQVHSYVDNEGLYLPTYVSFPK
jgi:hypothetical protein